jgi:pimeloyl-ACP methyl ester carboxylesterase
MDIHHESPDGYRQFARQTGQGPHRLLLVHGFPFDHTQWAPQSEGLGGVATLMAPDLRGLGRSAGSDDPSRYSMSMYADDLARWLDRAGWERTVLVGLSMGGYIAFEFVRRHPDRLLGLILADTQPAADPPEVRRNRQTTAERVRELGMDEVVPGLLDKVLGATTRRGRPEVVARVREMMAAAPVPGVVGALGAMARRPDSAPTLAGIGVPTLVVVGEEDTLTPPTLAEAITAAIPAARLIRIPQAGHISPLEDPDAFNTAVHSFLEGLRE